MRIYEPQDSFREVKPPMPSDADIRIYEGYKEQISKAKRVGDVLSIVNKYFARIDSYAVLRGRLDEAANQQITKIRKKK